MAKIPFTLEAWLKDKSQKVETRDGLAVTDIHLTKYRDENVVVYYVGRDMWICGEEGNVNIDKTECKYDLFLVTPEPELSEFEKGFADIISYSICAGLPNDGDYESALTSESVRFAKRYSGKLLDLARKELVDDMQLQFDDEINEAYYRGRKEGKAEALKDLPRWREWGNGAAGNSDGHPIALVSGAGGIRFVSVLGVTGEKYIMLDDLKKLPGFKEDER